MVAPSGPLPEEPFTRGLAWLRERYRVIVADDVMTRSGFLAGDDARRRSELRAALVAAGVKAVIAGRGGYGAMRLLDEISGDRSVLGSLVASPRWIVGFSDVTALHVEAARLGVASIHGPNVTGLGTEANREAWVAALERPGDASVWPGLTVLHEGAEAVGPVHGGNLALLHAMAASGRLAMPSGAVLLLEDVDERPYRVDRMLTSLLLGGHLARASAVVLGGFTRCDPAPDGVRVEEVLRERTASLGVLVVAGAPFGHGEINRAFVLGRDAVVSTKGASASVTFPPFASA